MAERRGPGRGARRRELVASAAALAALAAGPSAAERAHEANAAASALPPTVYADGSGLPEGSGSAREGAAIYRARCAGCHGANGEGGRAMELVGDRATLASEWPDRGIAAVWPYAPPLYDYVRRAMPPEAPYSLSADETYAVVARLLEMNALLAADVVLDRATLAALEMPAREDYYRARR